MTARILATIALMAVVVFVVGAAPAGAGQPGLVTATPAPVSVSLSSTVATGTTLARGSGPITFVLTAQNTATEATAVQVGFPLTGPLTIAGTAASAGPGVVVKGTKPNRTVSADLGTLPPGKTATVTVQVTVDAAPAPAPAAGAATGGRSAAAAGEPNKVRVGPPSGTFGSAPAEPATVSGAQTTYAYLIGEAADVTIRVCVDNDVNGVCDPAPAVTLNPDTADIVGRYVVHNAGPDPAAGVSFVADPPSPLDPGSLTPADISPGAGWTCSIQAGDKVRCDLAAPLIAGTDSEAVEVTWTIRGGGNRTLVATASTTTSEPPPADANNTCGPPADPNPCPQVVVNVPNRPPEALSGDQTVLKNTPKIVVSVVGSVDADGDQIFIESVTQPGNGTTVISADRQTITYTPNKDFVGLDCVDPQTRCSFSYVLSDGKPGGTARATVRVRVIDPPASTVKASSLSGPANAGGLPATGNDPLALSLAGALALLLGSALALAGARFRQSAVAPLHLRR